MNDYKDHLPTILECSRALREAGHFLDGADDVVFRLSHGYDTRETGLRKICQAIDALELAKKALSRVPVYQSYSPES